MSGSRLKVARHGFTKWLHCPKQYWSFVVVLSLFFRAAGAKRPLIGTNLQCWPTLVHRKVANSRHAARPASGKRLICVKPKVELLSHITHLAGAGGASGRERGTRIVGGDEQFPTSLRASPDFGRDRRRRHRAFCDPCRSLRQYANRGDAISISRRCDRLRRRSGTVFAKSRDDRNDSRQHL